VTNPATKVFDVTMRSFTIGVSPTISGLKNGDVVKLRIRVAEGDHHFELVGPTGSVLVDVAPTPGGAVEERTFTVNGQGTYTYFCTNSGCGVGHTAMTGDFTVGTAGPPDRGY
jgi:heme/copper-type cytochrome/quinol oxidase subunit 2